MGYLSSSLTNFDVFSKNFKKSAQDALNQEWVENTQSLNQAVEMFQRLSNKGRIGEFCLRFPTHTQVYKSQ